MAQRRRIKAIPTVHKGYRFRSRSEARWAVIFDALGLEWDYEPEGYDLGALGWYLPDFFVRYPTKRWPDGGYWVEVKGPHPTKKEHDKARALRAMTGHNTYIVYGTFNEPMMIGCNAPLHTCHTFPAMFLPFVGDPATFAPALLKARGATFAR